MCRSRPEWVDLVWTPGLVTCCEKVCRLFRHNSDPVFCGQRYFPEIFQISVTKDQAYESPICYAICVFASLLGDVATGCERKEKNLLLTIQLFSIASEIILQLWHFGILNCVSWILSSEKKHGSINVKKICEKFKMRYLSWLHYETSFSFLCFIGEKSFLATNTNFDLTNSQPRDLSLQVHTQLCAKLLLVTLQYYCFHSVGKCWTLYSWIKIGAIQIVEEKFILLWGQHWCHHGLLGQNIANPLISAIAL